jgi:DNA-binding NarL/FixJ family response regulator
MDVISRSTVEVAIVDLDLGPGPSGIDICYSLREHYPQLGLILLTSYSNPKIADPYSRPLPKGCRFLSKSTLTEFEVLVNSVISVKAKPHATFQIKTSNNVLTDTQLEVLKLVASGLSSAEIAERRNVSIKSIDGIISKIYKALNLKKSKSLNQRVQLARAYFQLSGKQPPGA